MFGPDADAPPTVPAGVPCPINGRAANAPAPSPNIPRKPRRETIPTVLSEKKGAAA